MICEEHEANQGCRFYRPMALQIVHYNNPVLRKKGLPITKFNAELTTIADDLLETMRASDRGIGLAAQQVGIALQICVVDVRGTRDVFQCELDGATPPWQLIMPMVLVNPKLTFLPSEETVYEEGCLSFPGIRGDVWRPDLIQVIYQDIQGTSHTLKCDGILSRCLQHEIDHLNGTLFIDRMEKAVRLAVDPEVKALAQATREEALK